ncbi:MAG: hypothetical protein C3F07_16705 [Anaerolineales bacterium]|nr:hypothetical protein [Anaerolineae bacterium]PWB70475.1 MAG: hypothetical protein C3F07_16705 [Anaerolineales bacterium]
MKKALLITLSVIVVLGLFAGVGLVGYRFGFSQGLQTSANGPARFGDRFPQFDRPLQPRLYDRDFNRGFPPGHPLMMQRGRFGFFAPLAFLWRIAVIGLVIWFAYWLFTRSGWQITRRQTQKTDADSTEQAGN